ncbi:ribosome biogenesis GTPase YlqF [Lactobacillus acetotolerans]|jgi:ribosome biogenesis GTPase A|uniref:Ribosome biogenesis GTPase A n=1 Tax=Lactobacillus acetotolerans TaxID=1600 RepID=A0A353UBT2_9LACO|nr:ribosome biogenesis GTPase YlqF [Lactobacillus acetotolerans]KRN41872.1 ribosome biogenesis GTP-binding protein YlqF [Lactobacillus acetotolerans DSM 20749 = JCM 3825]MBN7276015.1 ribosome biogenesis GTPase YlqF [Lactobacillus acetotolerans]QFG51342.1 ribosome biogenesis GTPase YlqF [Lactobacillus acetotolerans]QGV04545.1 ribosome biogenesis GTPase YlqF [Lactobacillus acetotolerans]QJD73638.1 ribosome biogenesis GTPase YlqF [Lactobacillus acetotolerans]
MATIQWYPGHMNKARNQLEDKMSLIDVVVEVLDARIPQSSRNPMIEKLVGDKPHLIILNKADLADPIMTKLWQKKLHKPGKYVMALDSLHNTNMQFLIKMVKKAASAKIKKMQVKGASNPTVRIALVGIPNCGKSTIINRLVGHNVARVGNTPGVTKGQSWLKTPSNIQILDTPGILWPRFDDQKVGYKLAAFGAIKDSVFHADDVALFVLKNLRQHYLKNLVKFARSTKEQIEQVNDPDLLLAMTDSYGMRDDYDRFSLYMLQRLRKGKVGRITLDRL